MSKNLLYIIEINSDQQKEYKKYTIKKVVKNDSESR